MNPARVDTSADGCGVAPDLPVAVRRHALIREVGRRLRDECGVPAGSGVMVALSGGADSCALLLACVVLASRRSRLIGRVTACHVHHQLRPEADDEAAFAASLCTSLGVPMCVEHIEPGKASGSVGANARRLRYEVLERAGRERSAACVATAHHAEDQLETMLMALGRGAGLRGLRGMAWRRALGEVTLVRPMLLARKRECEALCTAAGVTWRNDPTNVDMASKRARVRRDVLPVLEALWPGAARRSTGTAELLGIAHQMIETRVEDVFGASSVSSWARDEVAALPAGLIAEGLRRAAEQVHGGALRGLGQRQLRAAAAMIRSGERRPKRFAWPGGVAIEVTSKRVRVMRAGEC